MKSGETGQWHETLTTLGIGTSISSICMFLAMFYSLNDKTKIITSSANNDNNNNNKNDNTTKNK